MNQQWNPPFVANDERARAMLAWLMIASPNEIVSLAPMVGDASFRRYFRLVTTHGSYVVMDAPPQNENVLRFIQIANILRSKGLHAPSIIAENVQDGFLILTDFGDLTYLAALKTREPTPLYQKALQALSVIQSCQPTASFVLPHFTHDFMQSEWEWHNEWFLHGLLKLQEHDPALRATYDLLIESALLQPQVFMYRDFHAGNLMFLADGQVGLLDFQDAFIGPLTYDLVSLLRDCYIDWPKQQVIEWALFYYSLLHNEGVLTHVSEMQFLKWFDWMGIQRHLKALMTFARKALRDHNEHYLQFIPRTLNYIVTVSAQYDELTFINEFYAKTALPIFTRKFS